MNALRLALTALFSCVLALPASAATYVMMTDEALADGAPIIAEVWVEGVETGTTDQFAYTDYQMRIERQIKGVIPGSTIVVRLVGGQRADGMQIYLAGVPRFREGERALLFLSPHLDGTYGVYQLLLGAFYEVRQGGQRLAVRDLEDSEALDLSGNKVRAADQVRDFRAFSDWLAQRAQGITAEKSYLQKLPKDTFASLSERFRLSQFGGLNFRWQEFDEADNVTFFANQMGQPDLAGGGFAQFQMGIAAWNDDPATNVDYVYGGTTAASGGLSFFDGINAVQFDDPNNNVEAFGGPFNCASGGVIAIGGPWFDPGDPGETPPRPAITHTYQGSTFLSILGGDVVTNANVGCFLSLSGGQVAAEVFGHELGHTLGLSHSCGDGPSGPCDTTAKNDALMRAFAHGGNRGTSLADDDRAGLATIYTPIGTGTCTEDGQTLCLNANRFQVRVDWRTPQGDSGQGQAVELTTDTGYFWFFNSANVEMVIKVLNACSFANRYWVFAGGLTNVEVDITVTDTQTGTVKTYQNPLSTPFQPIQDTQAFATCP